jgi:hypothetical protein
MRDLAGLILALCAYGCGDPVQPTDVAGTYTLATVAGEALPWTVLPLNPDSDCSITITGGTLTLGADATYEMWLDGVDACGVSAEPTASSTVQFGEWRINGQLVTLVAIGDVRDSLPGRFIGERLLVEHSPLFGELGFDPGGQPRPALRRD